MSLGLVQLPPVYTPCRRTVGRRRGAQPVPALHVQHRNTYPAGSRCAPTRYARPAGPVWRRCRRDRRVADGHPPDRASSRRRARPAWAMISRAMWSHCASLSVRSPGASRSEQCHTGLRGVRNAARSGSSSIATSARTSRRPLAAAGGSNPPRSPAPSDGGDQAPPYVVLPAARAEQGTPATRRSVPRGWIRAITTVARDGPARPPRQPARPPAGIRRPPHPATRWHVAWLPPG